MEMDDVDIEMVSLRKDETRFHTGHIIYNSVTKQFTSIPIYNPRPRKFHLGFIYLSY